MASIVMKTINYRTVELAKVCYSAPREGIAGELIKAIRKLIKLPDVRSHVRSTVSEPNYNCQGNVFIKILSDSWITQQCHKVMTSIVHDQYAGPLIFAIVGYVCPSFDLLTCARFVLIKGSALE